MTDRWRRWGIVASVGLVHAGLFALLSLTDPPEALIAPPVIDVELIRPIIPPPPPPPPPPAPPEKVSGGGAPAAPSRIHTPPKPVKRPPELPAPLVQAPEPALVVGVAATADPVPGMGQGGQGTGTGTGVGSGDGPGSGTGCGFPRLLRGPSAADIVREAPPAARRARVTGLVNIRCELRPDSRLENCRVLNETPAGMGLGDAAIRVALARFRFVPPMRNGQPVTRCGIPLGIQFNLGGPPPPSGPLEG